MASSPFPGDIRSWVRRVPMGADTISPLGSEWDLRDRSQLSGLQDDWWRIGDQAVNEAKKVHSLHIR